MFGPGDNMLPLFMILVLVAIVVARHQVSRGRIRAAHRALADRYRGRVIAAGWDRPWTEFHVAGERVVVSVYREPSYGFFDRLSTHVHIAWPHAPATLNVRTQTLLSHLTRMLEGRVLSLGEYWFRQRFRVSSPDTGAARELLTPAVQRQIQRLANFGSSERFSLQIANGLLHVCVAGALDRTSELSAFVTQVLALHAEMTASFRVGIEFARSGEALPRLAGAKCQVCGDPIAHEHELVLCASCHTPHHRECWHYNGQCAIFGCREVHCTQAQPLKR